MVSPTGPMRIMYMPSWRPKPAWMVQKAESSLSASTARPQPCARNAYIPVRGRVSTPTRLAVVILPTPSDPGDEVPSVRVNAAGGAVAPPAVMTISLDGPRCGPWPVLTAVAKASQNAAPEPLMLSNISGDVPGRVTVRRQAFWLDPA